MKHRVILSVTLSLALAITLIACNQTSNEKMTDSNNVYRVIWKYRIKPEHKEKFEFEYGSNGTWSLLFAKSDKYKGSYLCKSETEANSYILIDTWINKQTYEDFKRINQEAYDQLSAGFEYHYETEEKIGSFIPVH